MDKVLSDFGVQPILLAAQAVNFLVLLLILNRFLYKPILKMLKTRKDKITESLKQVELIEKKLSQAEAEKNKTLEKAALEAKDMIEGATKAASQIIAEAHQKAALDIVSLVAKSNLQMKQERDQMHQEIKEELAELISEGLKVVAGKVLTEKDRQTLTKRSLKNLS